MSENDAEAVQAANARFYRALSGADLPLMEKIWSHEADVACLHPGWPLLRGWEDVRASWAGIFRHQGSLRIWPSDVSISVTGDLAWVLCTENVDASAIEEVVGIIIEVQATNIFRRERGDWYMVHHHAAQQSQRSLRRPEDLGPTISEN